MIKILTLLLTVGHVAATDVNTSPTSKDTSAIEEVSEHNNESIGQHVSFTPKTHCPEDQAPAGAPQVVINNGHIPTAREQQELELTEQMQHLEELMAEKELKERMIEERNRAQEEALEKVERENEESREIFESGSESLPESSGPFGGFGSQYDDLFE